MPATKTCPFCAEQIHADAKKCKHCGEFLDAAALAKSSRSPSASKNYLWNWNAWLSSIDSKETAKKKVRQGWAAAYFVAGLTTLLGFASIAVGHSIVDITAWSFLDVSLMAALGAGIQYYSRTAAVLALALFIFEKSGQVVAGQSFGAAATVIALLILFAFVNGVRGTFAYHRFAKLDHHSPKTSERRMHPALWAFFGVLRLFIVAGVTIVIAAIVIVAVNPTKQPGDARNAQRRSDVNTILNAVYEWSIDHNGVIPDSITTTSTEICRTTPTADCTGLADLSLLTASYLVAMPVDPQEGNVNATGYTIGKDMNGRITVVALFAEGQAAISVTR